MLLHMLTPAAKEIYFIAKVIKIFAKLPHACQICARWLLHASPVMGRRPPSVSHLRITRDIR